MFDCTPKARKRTVLPNVDTLEARELLSTVPHVVSILGQLPVSPTRTTSTVPANGDQNPYGVGFVPNGVAKGGVLHPGDVLVANFNNATNNNTTPPSGNLQGTGTTIVRVAVDGTQSRFYQGPPGVGLDSLSVLKNGYVVVGAIPSTDGTAATAGQGELLVLDKNGHLVTTFSDPNLLNGPWQLAVVDEGAHAQIFVSNVLSGTISRFNVSFPKTGGVTVHSATQIGSGFLHHGDPVAFEVGPAGLAYDPRTGNLYVNSEVDNSIYAIPNALTTTTDHGTGKLVVQDTTNLHGPLGLTLASDGHLIVANADSTNVNPNDPSTLVEYTRLGKFVSKFSLNAANGAAFGVTITHGPRPFLAAVNDATAALTLWHIHGTRPLPTPV